MQFDPVIVEAFVGALNAGTIHDREGGILLPAASFVEQGSPS